MGFARFASVPCLVIGEVATTFTDLHDNDASG